MCAQKYPQLLEGDIDLFAKETAIKLNNIKEHKILELEFQLFYFTHEKAEDQKLHDVFKTNST